MDDSVAVDAKRILLRYGAPITILDQITEGDRIAFARAVTHASLPERAARLKELLQEKGYLEPEARKARA